MRAALIYIFSLEFVVRREPYSVQNNVEEKIVHGEAYIEIFQLFGGKYIEWFTHEFRVFRYFSLRPIIIT